jgi:AraC-like DNA-binding protein
LRGTIPHSEALIYFKELAHIFNTEPVNNTISLPGNEGSGLIKLIDSNSGLHVTTWNIQVNGIKQFKKLPLRPASGKFFTIIASLSPKCFQIRKKEGTVLPDMIFMAAEYPLIYTFLPGHGIKALIINIAADWVFREFRDADPDLLFQAHDLFYDKKPLLFTEEASFTMHHNLEDMQELMSTDRGDPFYARAKTLSLLHDIFRRLQAIQPDDKKESTVQLHTKMLAVEKILDEYLDKNLPPIKTIAQQVSLSESTLKRNFKKVYGISIYEFYLKKKMQLARQLLDQQPISVKELAYMLGYEKTSNFITMFKKHYDFSPGMLRKKPPLD